MTYDPRVQRINTIMQTIRQNPFVANKNSMIKPLFAEVERLRELVLSLEEKVASLEAAPKERKPLVKKTEKKND